MGDTYRWETDLNVTPPLVYPMVALGTVSMSHYFTFFISVGDIVEVEFSIGVW